jgi:hypothetical protein
MPAAPMKNANPSGPSAKQRKMFAKMGIAMPDGSYYVRNAADLSNAIMAVGRGEAAGDSGNAIRVHIMKRAAALKLSSKIPDTWNADGSLKTSVTKHVETDSVDEFLAHFGVRGMKWGQHIFGKKESAPRSADSEQAHAVRQQAKKSGVHTLSNEELQAAITRMDLETRFAGKAKDTDPSQVNKGVDFVKSANSHVELAVKTYNNGMQVKKIVDGLKK